MPDSIPPPLAPSYVAHGGRLGGWLLSVSEAARFYAVLAAFPLLCLAWSLPARLLTILLPRRIQPRLGRFGITTGFRLYLGLMRLTGLARFDLSALDRLREDRGVIIIANHRSLIDAVLMLSRLPRVTCISKAALWTLTQTLALALHLLETAAGPQTTMQSPLRWNADGKWKLDYLNLEQIGETELRRRREEFDRQKELARPNRTVPNRAGPNPSAPNGSVPNRSEQAA